MKRFTVKRALFAIGVILVAWFALSNYLYYRRLYAPTPEGAFHKLATVHTELVTRKVSFIDRVLGFIRSPTGNAPSSASSSRSLSRVPEDEELLGLDKKYGHLSEYWEMRPESKGFSKLESLRKAYELNPDVPDVVYLLAREEYRALGEAWKQGDPWKAEWDEMVMTGARDALELEPDNGAWHLLIAVEQNSLGMWNESVEKTKLAAEAPAFRSPKLYPVREYDALLLDLQRNTRLGVRGLGFLQHMTLMTNYYFRFKDLYKNVQIGFSLSGDVDMLTTYNRAAVRIALAPNADHIDRMVGSALMSVLANSYIDLLEEGELAPEAVAIRSMLEGTEGFWTRWKVIKGNSSFPRYMFVDEYEPADELNSLNDSEASRSAIELQKQIVALEIVRRQAERDLAREVFEPLLAFDYADPVGSIKAIEEREAEIAERERAARNSS